MTTLSFHDWRLAAAQKPSQSEGGRAVATVTNLIRTWRERARQRRELALLDARDLRDIGISIYDAEYEIYKPFWRD
ncbi:MAG: DUF1127 domain-containing protein [Proteobacteria bacterium]|nr:DUF1127 domain-containing protein [Pseudomonadota bacterium]MBI3497562.1 DUF1127 domain-containing protein [Pseudomonadota bacterium]